jgi:hypothetical protein
MERLDHLVAGVLFDFGGFLTTRETRITLSGSDDASPMVDALHEFMKLRGVDVHCEPMIEQWPARCGLLGEVQ